MRLIDADEIGLTDFEIVMCNGDYKEALKMLLDKISNQPTAYSVDGVVEELEERKALHERLVDYETKNGTVTEKYQHIKAIDVLNDAIEIVKQGGVSDDVCEWKLETNGIAWHCDEKCTTYNQAYIKDLKITLEDFECKCPYCKKKIKVVE